MPGRTCQYPSVNFIGGASFVGACVGVSGAASLHGAGRDAAGERALEDEEEDQRGDQRHERARVGRRGVHHPVPWSDASAMGIVWVSLVVSMTSGMKNSFHVQMKKKIMRTPSVGLTIGYTSCHRIRQRPAPSSWAASSSAGGNVPS